MSGVYVVALQLNVDTSSISVGIVLLQRRESYGGKCQIFWWPMHIFDEFVSISVSLEVQVYQVSLR